MPSSNPRPVYPTDQAPSPAPTPRRSRWAVVAAVAGMVVSALVAVPVLAEISPNAEITWGVYDLDTTTETDAIRSHVWAIEQIGDRVYVGGKFLEARPNSNQPGQWQPYLAAFDLTTGAFIDSFRPELESAVYSLQASPDGSRLFVGGEFRSINGDDRAHGLAALDPVTGDVDPTWRAKVTNTSGARPVVYGLTVHGDQLYLAGRFDRVGAGSAVVHTTEKVARVGLAAGTVDTTLTTDIDGGSVWGVAVAPDGSKIFLAGYHDAVDGNAAGADYSVLNANGSLIPGWSDVGGNSASPSRWYGQDVVVTDDLVFWGGSEHIVRVFSLADGSLVREHSTYRGGDYQDLEVVGDRVYASCHCYTVHAADYDGWGRWGNLPAEVLVTPIKYVAAYSASTGAYIPEFQLDASATRAGVWAIHGDTLGCLWVGGDLSRVTTVTNRDRAAGGFARFCEGNGTDALAPGPPGGLTQTRAEKTRIVVRWDEAPDNIGVTAYEVSRGGQVVATVAGDGSSQYWYTDSDLTEATVYGYEVVAVDGAGNRSEPATLEAATAGAAVDDTEAPTTPTNLTQTRSEAAKIVIRWEAATDNAAVTSYEISRDNTPIATKTATTASTYWQTDTGLTQGTTYTYTVTAIDAAGNRSQPATLDATTTGVTAVDDTEAPTTPTNLTQTRSEAAKIVIRWEAATDNAAVTSYEISRDNTPIATKTATTASTYWQTDTGLTQGTTYTYTVTAIDAAGNRSQPATLDATTTGVAVGAAPAAPTGLRSTNQTRDRIVLNWAGSSGAVGYAIERDDGLGVGFVEVGTKDSTASSVWFTDQSVAAGTSYSYRVVAVSADGLRSEPGAPLTVTTLD